MKHAASICSIGVLGLLMNGCSGGAPAEGSLESSAPENTETAAQAAQLTLLAEANLEHDRQVRFYDFEGIGISIVEIGRAEHIPHESPGAIVDAAEYYQALTGKKAPL